MCNHFSINYNQTDTNFMHTQVAVMCISNFYEHDGDLINYK